MTKLNGRILNPPSIKLTGKIRNVVTINQTNPDWAQVTQPIEDNFYLFLPDLWSGQQVALSQVCLLACLLACLASELANLRN